MRKVNIQEHGFLAQITNPFSEQMCKVGLIYKITMILNKFEVFLIYVIHVPLRVKDLIRLPSMTLDYSEENIMTTIMEKDVSD